jgi:hypothetical protein
MSGLKNWMESMSGPHKDTLVQVVQDLQDSTSPDRLESLRQFLSTLTREIEAINRKRDAMGQKVSNIDVLLPLLDEQVRANPDNLEVDLFRNMLVVWRSALKTEIAEMRPDGKLEKKYDTERKRDLLGQLQGVVVQLSRCMSEAWKTGEAKDRRAEPVKAT